MVSFIQNEAKEKCEELDIKVGLYQIFSIMYQIDYILKMHLYRELGRGRVFVGENAPHSSRKGQNQYIL